MRVRVRVGVGVRVGVRVRVGVGVRVEVGGGWEEALRAVGVSLEEDVHVVVAAGAGGEAHEREGHELPVSPLRVGARVGAQLLHELEVDLRPQLGLRHARLQHLQRHRGGVGVGPLARVHEEALEEGGRLLGEQRVELGE